MAASSKSSEAPSYSGELEIVTSSSGMMEGERPDRKGTTNYGRIAPTFDLFPAEDGIKLSP